MNLLNFKAYKATRITVIGFLLLPLFGYARSVLPLYDASTLKSACDKALKIAAVDVKKLENIPMQKVDVNNTLNAWDAMQIRLEVISGPAVLYSNVAVDEKTRAEGDACNLKLSAFSTRLGQNKKIYQRIKAVKTQNSHEQKFRQDLIESFEDSGVVLPTNKRKRVQEIFDRLEGLKQVFDKNVREDKTRLSFSSDEVKGLPSSYIDKAKKDDKGNYLLGFDYPEYEPFMRLADNEPARKRYYIAFNRRGGEKNLQLMNEIATLRLELAKIFNLPSYAHYVLRRRMAESPGKVNTFLDQVKDAVREGELKDIQLLKEKKGALLGQPLAEVKINRWEVGYYQEKLRKEKFNIDQEALRKYFPMPASMDFVLYVSSQLYGVKFQKVDVPVWHKDVSYYDVIDEKTGKFLSGFYLDLYPRDGKYKHAAAFGVRTASWIADRKPVSVLVANLDRAGLNHGELETLFHEFGHVLNHVLSVVDYTAHGWPQWDFVEAPSQMYEEWARRSESLSLFKKVCESCPIMDNDLIQRIDDARRFGSGLAYGRQHLYAAFDMAMTSDKPRAPLDVWKTMESHEPLGHVEGTMFPANFTHIVNSGYGAGYYGYMWSEVLALDMLSIYGDNLMNPVIGKRFRDTILSQGGQFYAKDMAKNFLGREPSNEAFFKEVAGQRVGK